MGRFQLILLDFLMIFGLVSKTLSSPLATAPRLTLPRSPSNSSEYQVSGKVEERYKCNLPLEVGITTTFDDFRPLDIPSRAMLGFSATALQALQSSKIEARAHWDTPVPRNFWSYNNPIFGLYVDFTEEEEEPKGGQRLTFKVVLQALLCVQEFAKSLGRREPAPSFSISINVQSTGETVAYGDFDTLETVSNRTS